MHLSITEKAIHVSLAKSLNAAYAETSLARTSKKKAVRKKGIRANDLRSARYAWRAEEEKNRHIIFTFRIFHPKNEKNPDAHQPFGSIYKEKKHLKAVIRRKSNASAEFVACWNVVKNQCECGERSSGMT